MFWKKMRSNHTDMTQTRETMYRSFWSCDPNYIYLSHLNALISLMLRWSFIYRKKSAFPLAESSNYGEQGEDDRSADQHLFKLATRQSKLISSCLLNSMQFPSSYISWIMFHHGGDQTDGWNQKELWYPLMLMNMGDDAAAQSLTGVHLTLPTVLPLTLIWLANVFLPS